MLNNNNMLLVWLHPCTPCSDLIIFKCSKFNFSYSEFHPLLYEQHVKEAYIEFDSFDKVTFTLVSLLLNLQKMTELEYCFLVFFHNSLSS